MIHAALVSLMWILAAPGGDRPALPAATALDGSTIDWKAARGGAIVIVFYSAECPISNGYSPTLNALAASLPKSVRLVAASVDDDLSDAELRAHARDHRLAIPLVRDRKAVLSTPLGVRVTPEAVVLDDSGTIRYRGRIDDAYAARGKPNASPRATDLKDAIDAVLAGRDPAAPWPAAVGCPLPDRS